MEPLERSEKLSAAPGGGRPGAERATGGRAGNPALFADSPPAFTPHPENS